jgi:tRNA (guanine37-N1)-methyltransferase
MRYDIITLFPALFTGIFDYGVIRRARANGLVEIGLHDLRQFAHDRHRTVDDRPFGGGEGMVLKPEPLAEALESLGIVEKGRREPQHLKREAAILLSAQGRRFTQAVARELAGLDRLVLICGRYEGVDERINELFCDHELSVGDYVLSGGELPAAILVDATMRLLPGVLGNEASTAFESFGPPDAQAAETESSGRPRATHGAGGLLDYPHYTRPAEFRGLAAPAVLAGGDHAYIRQWRRLESLRKTLRNRPDLLEGAELDERDRTALERLRQQMHGPSSASAVIEDPVAEVDPPARPGFAS